MASLTTSVKGCPNRCSYGVTKAAILGLTKSIAVDYVEKGIHINSICPGKWRELINLLFLLHQCICYHSFIYPSIYCYLLH